MGFILLPVAILILNSTLFPLVIQTPLLPSSDQKNSPSDGTALWSQSHSNCLKMDHSQRENLSRGNEKACAN